MTTLVTALAGAVAVAAGGQADPAHVEPCDGRGDGAYRIVELRNESATLVLFGARHRTAPDDPILSEIERRVAALVPTVILVEGPAAAAEPDRATAIARGGEMGLLCWLANRRGVPCESSDLTEAEEVRRLLRRHPADEVLLFLSVRVLAYFNPRPPSQRPPGDLVEWTMRRYAPLVGLPVETAGQRVARACERSLGRPWEPSRVTTDWHDPTKDELLTQRLSRESNDLREPYMIDRLLEAARPGARAFAALGEGHVCNVGAALRARWK